MKRSKGVDVSIVRKVDIEEVWVPINVEDPRLKCRAKWWEILRELKKTAEEE